MTTQKEWKQNKCYLAHLWKSRVVKWQRHHYSATYSAIDDGQSLRVKRRDDQVLYDVVALSQLRLPD